MRSFFIVDVESTLYTAADEGMPNRPSIFAYLVFGPEGITRPMKISAWRGPGTYLGVQDEDSKKET
jgi:hypothetical protein